MNQSLPISRPKFSTVNFETMYGKQVTAELVTKDEEVTIKSLMISTANGFSFYDWKYCRNHQWLLYKAVKNQLFE